MFYEDIDLIIQGFVSDQSNKRLKPLNVEFQGPLYLAQILDIEDRLKQHDNLAT